MKDHRYVRQVEGNELSEFETYPVFTHLSELDLGPAHIDVGRLAVRFQEEGAAAEGGQYPDRNFARGGVWVTASPVPIPAASTPRQMQPCRQWSRTWNVRIHFSLPAG